MSDASTVGSSDLTGADLSSPGTPDGPIETLLTFAVFGDARPPIPDDVLQYPSTIVAGIFSQAQAQGAQFVIGTGDYMNGLTSLGVDTQVSLFLKAQSNFKGPVYLALGNHECMTVTSLNCPTANESPNIQAFMTKLAPSGTTTPYYRIDKSTPFGNAKFILLAANAWTDAQGAWLTQQLADTTTYTFIVRHEPSDATTPPAGVAASDAILQSATITIEFLGHIHEYRHVDANHVIAGNGGAPLENGATNYGWLRVEQQADGNIAVSAVDEASGTILDAWRVKPNGQAI